MSDDRDEPTVMKISEGECTWAVDDPHWRGHQMPHGIRARRRVSGAGEFYSGDFCIRHAALAVQYWRQGSESEF